MTIGQQRGWARLLLAVLVAAGLAWIVRLDRGAKISTDVLDLIPRGSRQPELALVRSLASDRAGRVVLLAVEVGDPAGERAAAAAQALAAGLRESGCFESVVVLSDPAGQDAVGRAVFERRLDLLLPQWLDRQWGAHAAAGAAAGPIGPWVAERAAADLEGYLSRPEAIAFQDLLPSDPLLLVPGLVDRLQGASLPGTSPRGPGLVWALQREAPLLEAGQKPVFDAIGRATRAMVSVEPSARLRWTGVARFAAGSRARIQKELGWLNLASLALVGAVAALCLSRALPALNLVPPVLAGLLGAWVFTTAGFERVHVLVFVIGSLLGGVAVDYGFYLYLQPPLYPDEPYGGKLRRLLKPLLASALTTVLGFSLLLASDLPLIRQMGVFVSAGLLCALAASILWFGQLRRFHLPARAAVSRRLPDTPAMRRAGRLVFWIGLPIALIGPWFLRWRDDIRMLEIPAPELRSNDLEIRSLFGEGAGRSVYLTRGNTPAEAREAWGRFAAWEAERPNAAPLFSLALAVPRESEWAAVPARLKALGDFEGDLRAALVRHGFDASSFDPFFRAWRRWLPPGRPSYDTLVRDFTSSLPGPSGLLASTRPGACWFASVVSQGAPLDPPPELSTLATGRIESLNRLFAEYRLSAVRLSSVGLGLVGLSVFVLYGIRRGIRVFAIPSGACLCAFGLLGLFGSTLNLFHLLGAFLGVCLSHNYAIFSTENSLRGEGAPPSIRLSALATALSFGVLAFSHIPVVAALGTSVATVVVFAILIVEMEPFFPGALEPAPARALRLESAAKIASKRLPNASD